MVVTQAIGTYKVLLLDGQADAGDPHAGFVYFYAPSGVYLGYVCGIREGNALPDTRAHQNGVVHIHVREAEMHALIGMLQNEPTAHLSYDTVRRRGTVSPAAVPHRTRLPQRSARQRPGRTAPSAAYLNG